MTASTFRNQLLLQKHNKRFCIQLRLHRNGLDIDCSSDTLTTNLAFYKVIDTISKKLTKTHMVTYFVCHQCFGHRGIVETSV